MIGSDGAKRTGARRKQARPLTEKAREDCTLRETHAHVLLVGGRRAQTNGTLHACFKYTEHILTPSARASLRRRRRATLRPLSLRRPEHARAAPGQMELPDNPRRHSHARTPNRLHTIFCHFSFPLFLPFPLSNNSSRLFAFFSRSPPSLQTNSLSFIYF